MSKLMIPLEVQEKWDDAILRGMTFLDGYLGSDWPLHIDLDRLALNDTRACVCGQLFDEEGKQVVSPRGYDISGYDWAVKNVLEHGVPTNVRVDDPAVYLGFNLEDDGEPEEDLIAQANGYADFNDAWHHDFRFSAWDLFTAAWSTAIEKRKAELGAML